MSETIEELIIIAEGASEEEWPIDPNEVRK